MGIKTESYPFDWMVSRLPVIQDCIETDFAFFTNPHLYSTHETHTTHYHKGTNPTPMQICRETIYRNDYYQEHPVIQDQIRIPQPLSTEKGDTYAHTCIMNHRNIHDPDTQSYYQRCIQRFQCRLASPEPVVAVYIHPTLTEAEYADQRELLHDQFRHFQTHVLPEHWQCIFFCMVRTDHPYPITDYKPHVIERCFPEKAEEFKDLRSKLLRPTDSANSLKSYGFASGFPRNPQFSEETTSRIQIFTVYTNRDFIDAGEIFMQNAYIETDNMCKLLETLLSRFSGETTFQGATDSATP
jgi:hypothetical protein